MEVFNSDFFNDRLIDTGLNVIGYTAAGLLWMLVYSAFSRRTRRSETAASPSDTVSESHAGQPSPAKSSSPKTRTEFISLDSTEQPSVDSSVPSSSADEVSTADRRNRSDIIRVAREMIKNGVAKEMIKRTLPITDGELSLLIQSTK